MFKTRVAERFVNPQTIPIMGVPVANIDMPGLIDAVDMWTRLPDRDRPGRYVCYRDVHGLIRAQDDPALMAAHHKAMLVVPDGMPLVWVSRWRGAGASGRVAGMDALPRLIEAGVSRGWRHVFLGGAEGIAEKLAVRMREIYPGAQIVGIECPPFRPMSDDEVTAMIDRINALQADIVWVGLGSPKQDLWMAEHSHRLRGAISMGVGGAFDVHAGTISRAPQVLQDAGLEWAYRIAQEPRRLWRRYFETMPRFIAGVFKEQVAMPVTDSSAPLMLARATGDMTPPGSIKDAAKRFLLRKVHDRIRPFAYNRIEGGIKPLTFHYLFDQDRDNALAIFRALKREGEFVSSAELKAILDSGKPVRQRLFHLSIDDGFTNIIDNAHPLLRGENIPYALMVCPSFVGATGVQLQHFSRNAEYKAVLPMASWDQLRQIAAEGTEIGAHTMNHRNLGRIGEDELAHEIVTPKQRIEQEIGRPCTSFAWPFGRSDAITSKGISLAQEAGYHLILSSLRGTLQGNEGRIAYVPRHHFEPDWPVQTVVFYATRREGPFAIAPQLQVA